jgi:hypothetical protein
MKQKIIFVALCVIAFSCGSPEPQYSAELIDSLCQTQIDQNSGEFISVDAAYGKLDLYKTFKRKANSAYDPKKDIYGFVFGLDKVKQLIAKIDTINKHHPDSLVAIRIYFGRSRGSGKGEVPDIFVLPVDKNHNNMYPVDDDSKTLGAASAYKSKNAKMLDEVAILNTSVPCPNKCND